MKKILFVLTILLFASSCGDSNETPAPKPPTSKYQKYANENEIKIMSFNVRTKTSNDTGVNHWDQRKEACVALVKDHHRLSGGAVLFAVGISQEPVGCRLRRLWCKSFGW